MEENRFEKGANLEEAIRVLDEIGRKISEHEVLKQIFDNYDGNYGGLIDKYGEDAVSCGISLIKLYRIIRVLTVK